MKMSLVPQIEKQEIIIQFAQSIFGKLVILGGALSLLWIFGYEWIWQTGIVLLLMTFLVSWRRQILLIGTVSFWLSGQGWINRRLNDALERAYNGPFDASFIERALIFTLALSFCYVIYSLFTQHHLAKRISLPFFWILASYFCFLTFFSYVKVPAQFEVYTLMFSTFFSGFLWFLGYSLEERHNKAPTNFARQYGHYVPFWSPGIEMPFPKGAAYLNRIEAKSPHELAITQLKGLKLIYWGILLYLCYGILRCLLYGYSPAVAGGYQLIRDGSLVALIYHKKAVYIFGDLPWNMTIPYFFATIDQCSVNNCGNWLSNWSVTLGRFVTDLLRTAVFFHIAIGIVRLAGFNALRGTRNPLASKSIADFWNRYDYYYKELLVNLFYLPFFLRFFRHNPLLRMYFSLLVAVFLGNFIFHLFWHQRTIMELGMMQAMVDFQAEAVFDFLLANGIFISQWLQQNHPPSKHWFMVKIITPIRVMGFFCLIWIFADGRAGSDVMHHIRFFYSLFGMNV
jgi:hypothetical protein